MQFNSLAIINNCMVTVLGNLFVWGLDNYSVESSKELYNGTTLSPLEF